MTLAMSTQLFPDLEGDFELASESIGGQLDAGSIQAAIAEQQSRRNHWRLRWQHVQYGVYQGEPVCLMVIDGRFHAEDPKRHRFTWLRISVEFAGSGLVGESVEVKRYSPERAYGISVAEQRTSSWALRSKISVTIPGVPLTVDLLDGQKNESKSYKIDRIASMQGSDRGFPLAKEVVWTLNEAMEEGIPWRIPSLVILLKSPVGKPFSAKFKVQTKVAYSINFLRLPIREGPPLPVQFDGTSELVPPSRELNRDFTVLNFAELTKLNFVEDK